VFIEQKQFSEMLHGLWAAREVIRDLDRYKDYRNLQERLEKIILEAEKVVQV